MYALTIIETDSYRQALITRTILESGGFPTVAAAITLPDGTLAHAAFTSAPDGYPAAIAPIVLGFDAMGDVGLDRAKGIAARSNPSARAVPLNQRDDVRNALLQTVYGVANSEGATVQSEPAASTLKEGHDSGDEHNPEGGGFDGNCIGADKWDNWKPARDVAH
jgi:hypothetical protein